MDASAVKRTQETLGRVIRKPPLTEKLLGKPPFRFLHDVITEVIRTTGFMKGLYGESDMKSDNVKEREAKITFLQKAIDVVAMASGEAVPVRPSKIVAGHEPERTNEFLQALAQCCLSKLPSEDAVRRVLAGEKPDAKSGAAPVKTQGKENRDERPSRQRETKKEVEFKEPSGSRERQEKEASSQDRHHRDRDKDKSKDGDKDKGRDRDREREKERHAAKDGERERERTKDGHRDRGSERRREKETYAEGSKERERDGARERERGGERRERGGERKEREERGDHRVAAGSSKDKDRRSDKQRDEEKKDVKSRDREPPTAATLEDARGLETGSPARVVRPPTAKGHRRRHRDVVTNDAAAAADEEAEGAQKEEGAPVNGDAADVAALPLQRRPPRPSSARPAAPRIRRQESAETHPTERTGSAKAVANVIVEGGRNSDGGDDDDDEQFVVAESTPAPSDSLDAGPLETTQDNDGEEHGGLVKKILETKKGYGTTRTPPKVVMDGARQKGREAAVRETERLRGAVQALCRSTLPLSKVMDYLQEDLDAMHAELATWTRQRRQHAEALADQHRLTEKALEPLRAELTTLDQQIQEQLEQIGAVKASVHRNDEKIDKMIGSIGAGARA